MKRSIYQLLFLLGWVKPKAIVEKTLKEELMKLCWRHRKNSNRDRLIEKDLIELAHKYGCLGIKKKGLIVWQAGRKEVLCIKPNLKQKTVREEALKVLLGYEAKDSEFDPILRVLLCYGIGDVRKEVKSVTSGISQRFLFVGIGYYLLYPDRFPYFDIKGRSL